MNSHQRKVARRKLARAYPLGLVVTRWFMPHTLMKVVGYDGRHVRTADVDGGRNRLTLPYSFQKRA